MDVENSTFIVRALSTTSGAGGSVHNLASAMTESGHNAIVVTSKNSVTNASYPVYTYGTEVRLPHRLALNISDEDYKARVLAIETISPFLDWQDNLAKQHNLGLINAATPLCLQADIITPRSSIILEFMAQMESYPDSLQDVFRRTTLLRNPLYATIAGLEIANLQLERRAKRVIAISRLQQQQLHEVFRIPIDDIDVVYNGTDIERFHPDNKQRYRENIRRNLGLDEESTLIGFIGVNYRRKGLDVLIKSLGNNALSKLKWVLVVAGKDSEDEYKKLAFDLDVADKIRFLGQQTEIEKLFAALDLFAFPTRVDPFGKVIAEAAATGIPVITSDQAGAAELLKHGKSAYIIPISDLTSLTNAVEELVVDDQRREEMGLAARKAVESYTWRKAATDTIEVYGKLL